MDAEFLTEISACPNINALSWKKSFQAQTTNYLFSADL